MTENKPPFYITTPIYYVNDSPHIGHAYTTIACDVMARFMRLDGHEVMFLTGTDEHGQKVAKAAEQAGKSPQELCDEVSVRFRNLVASGDNLLNVTNDDFIRTTEARHKKAAQELWRRIAARKTPKGNPNIYKDTYGGWYAVRDEAYYAESELTLKDGKKLAPSGAEVEWVEEESYFFKLSEFQERLLKLYEECPDFVLPQARLNEVRSFVAGGLKDLSISRTTFDWGVEVPDQKPEARSQKPEGVSGEASRPSEPSASSHASDSMSRSGDNKKHVMYVWIDALTNYITATGWPETGAAGYAEFWGQPTTHVVGKDILRFHAVYWPAFLMAADLPLPRRIVAHGWWTIEGEKMSKSLGNVLSPAEMIEAAGGVDQLRYFMLKAMPFGNDGDFSRERMVEVINADLANNIGNLAQRTLSMIQKNCGGVVPGHGEYSQYDKEQSPAAAHLKTQQRLMTEFDYQQALDFIVRLAGASNEYIDKQAPWTLKKEGKQKEMEHVLYVLAENVRRIALLLQPFCPAAAEKILDQLAIPSEQRKLSFFEATLKPGTPLPAPEGVFPRLQSEEKAA